MTQMGDSIRRRSGGGGRGRGRGAGKPPREGTRARGRAGESSPSLDWKRWILGGLGGALLAFVMGWLIAVYVLFPKPALARDEVAVPSLEGMSLEEASSALATARLDLGRVREMVHPTARRGEVIAQDPVSGQRLRPGSEVRVAVSQGRARVTVPDLVGMPADAALELARRVGFEPERMEEPTVEEAGRVLRTQPAAGERAELPARLLLVVSAGGLAPPDTLPAALDSVAMPGDRLPYEDPSAQPEKSKLDVIPQFEQDEE